MASLRRQSEYANDLTAKRKTKRPAKGGIALCDEKTAQEQGAEGQASTEPLSRIGASEPPPVAMARPYRWLLSDPVKLGLNFKRLGRAELTKSPLRLHFSCFLAFVARLWASPRRRSSCILRRAFFWGAMEKRKGEEKRKSGGGIDAEAGGEGCGPTQTR